MEIILRSPVTNYISNILTIQTGTIIPIITASITISNSIGLPILYTHSNYLLKLELYDNLSNKKVNYLNGTKEVYTNNGIAYFLQLSISKPGDYSLICSISNNSTAKSGNLKIKVNYDYSKLHINKIFGSLRILPNKPNIYVFDIVDSYGNHINNSTQHPLPDLNIGINFVPWINNLQGYESQPSITISPDNNGIYNFIFNVEKNGTYFIYITSNNYLGNTTIYNIFNYFFYINVLISDNASECPEDRFNFEFSYQLIESIYLSKKIQINNHLFVGLPFDKRFDFETGLTSSQNLNYKINNPQELSSIPHRVDNSKGTVDPTFPWFNPRLRPIGSYNKNIIKGNRIVTEFLLNNPQSRGLNSSSLTNMIVNQTRINGPNNFVIRGALTNTDVILKNIVNNRELNLADPLVTNLLKINPVNNKIDIAPRFPQVETQTGSASSETNYQKYKANFPGCNCHITI